MDASSILIIGSNGQLGTALKNKYPGSKALGSSDLDITSQEQINTFDFAPYKVFINAAAYTDVDGAESAEGRVVSWQVNSTAVAQLVEKLLKQDVVFIHLSTDYVFDGTKSIHKEEEPLSPLGVYGQSKAAGDLVVGLMPKHYLIRTSWVIGEGKNFVRTMLGLANQGITPTVVSDVSGLPTFTGELVRAIDHLLTKSSPYGTYNVTNGGDAVSWAELARETFKIAGTSVEVKDTTNDEYYADKTTSAPRPRNSIFDLSKIQATGFTPKDWREDLAEYISKENQTT